MSIYAKFKNLTFNDFRKFAKDTELSPHEKVGFPNDYREGKEAAIFEDIVSKLPLINTTGKIVLEVGPGCSNLPQMLADVCSRQKHRLIFVDSAEMLEHLPNDAFIEKYNAQYPEVPDLIKRYTEKVDMILVYSVVQYIFTEGNIWNFLDRSLQLLATGGYLLIGDIPNITMRKRFFSSAAGKEYHRTFMGVDEDPDVRFNQLEPGAIDDSVIMGLMQRARASGFHAWILPQAVNLPMANRREDILIRKP